MMHHKKLLCALLALITLMAGAAYARDADDEDIIVVEYVLYADGTVSFSNSSAEDYQGYELKNYMTLQQWSFVMDPTGLEIDNMTEDEIVAAWEAGMTEWNDHLTSPLFSMDNTIDTVTANPAGGMTNYNHINTISFVDLGEESSTLARTWAYLSSKTLEGYPVTRKALEVDIVFNTRMTWTDASKNGASGYDIRSIATHELGHTLGLGDVYDSQFSYVTMYGIGKWNSIIQRTVEEPDLIGLSQLYSVRDYGGPWLPTPTPVPTAAPTPEPTPYAKLTSDFILPRDIVDIEADAFKGCAFTAAELPDGAKSIGSCAFADCASLSQIIIPASVSDIADDAFDGSSPVVITPEGSTAYQYAVGHGLNVVSSDT